MSHHDVFNGDADGICALHQLRLASPQLATLVTGVKRDIELLARVRAAGGDSVTVLDVSLDRNRAALLELLASGVRVEYFDHHFAGDIPAHPMLAAHIDIAPGVCTSALVDSHLDGRFRPWAAVAAFGDNLHATAQALARACGIGDGDMQALRELGESMNYNGYGDTEADLLIAPADLYRALQPFAHPLDFIAGHELPRVLAQARRDDMALAAATATLEQRPGGTLAVLPAAAWARRVQGEFANGLAATQPERAHAVLCELADGYCVSVRAPMVRPRGADALCRQFPTGGGRAAAAGIDQLARAQLGEFVRAFDAAFAAARPRDR